MAVTVTPNLTDISTVEVITGWSSGPTFGTAGTALISGDGVFVQGTDSASEKISKSNADWIQLIRTAQDMSAADTHLYWWLLTAIRPQMTAMEIRIGDSSGNYKGWNPATFTGWDGSWKCFVQDLSATPNTSSGTVDMTDITTLGVLYTTVGQNFRAIENCWVDACRFGTGLTATGTDFDLADIAAEDELVANKYGILQNEDDVIFSQGRLQIGNGATTTTFNSTDEVLVFRDADVSSTLYELSLVGSGNTSVIKGLVCKAAGTTTNARYYLDASGVTTDVTISGSTFIRAGLIDFASTSDVQTSSFNNCLQIDPSTGIFQNNTVSNYAGTEGGAILWGDSSNTKDLNIINCDNGIEFSTTTSPKSLDNIIFDDEAGNFDVNNTSGSAVTVGLVNGSNANSYNTGGSAVTFVAAVLIKVTVLDDSTGLPIPTAHVRLIKESDSSVILSGAVDGVGVISDSTYNYAGDTTVIGWARKWTLSGVDYIEKAFNGTITSSGLDMTIKLTRA